MTRKRGASRSQFQGRREQNVLMRKNAKEALAQVKEEKKQNISRLKNHGKPQSKMPIYIHLSHIQIYTGIPLTPWAGA
jgi:hypothetical protein